MVDLSKKQEEYEKDILPEPNQSRCKIMCDGQAVYVGASLYDALRVLTQKNTSAEYWIDAICINQQDIAERNAQVQLMDRIYQQASKVIVWLGTCSLLMDDDIRVLAKLHPGTPRQGRRVKANRSENNIVALIYMFSLRWFGRLWVIQEFCFVKKAIFMIGPHEVSATTIFADLEKYVEIWRFDNSFNEAYMENTWKRAFSSQLVDKIPHAISLLNSRDFIMKGQRFSIETWGELCADHEASDARDMLYGGLSLIDPDSLMINVGLKPQTLGMEPLPEEKNDTTDFFPRDFTNLSLWPTLHADYNASISWVLLNFAACLLSRPNNLFLLSLASRNPKHEIGGAVPLRSYSEPKFEDPFPSWYPLPWLPTSRLVNRLVLAEGSQFSACTNASAVPSISADGLSLFLEAATFGVLYTRLGPLPRGGLCHHFFQETWLSFANENFQSLSRICLDWIETRQDIGAGEALGIFSDAAIAGMTDTTNGAGNIDSGISAAERNVAGLCHYIHELLTVDSQSVAELIEFRNNEDKTSTGLLGLLKPGQAAAKQDEVRTLVNAAVRRQNADYASLKAACPEAPWPGTASCRFSEKQGKLLALDYRRKYKRAAKGRSLFVTDGRELVLGPTWAAKDDVVSA